MHHASPAIIRDALGVLLDPGTVVELRVLQTQKGVVSGYFDDLSALAEAAACWSGRAAGAYVTVNPVEPTLLARSPNRVTERAKHATRDHEIARRRWLFIDLDPVRPSGVAATDTEHQVAADRVSEIRTSLSSDGWPDPLLVDSGNGAYLLYRIDLPNDASTTSLIKQVLARLALRFGDDRVVIDQATANAGRLIRLPGTLNMKGDNTVERPHRLARLVDRPDHAISVPPKLLEALSAPQIPKAPRGRPSSHRPGFDLDGWIAKYQPPVVRAGSWNGGRKWILRPCPFDSTHTNGAAYIVQFANGAIAAGCHHNGCVGKGWRELRELFEPGSGASADADDEPTGNQAAMLIALAAEVELFHAPDGETPYVTATVNGHRETLPLRSRAFRHWLVRRFFQDQAKPPQEAALSSALGYLEACARYDSPECQVFVRVGQTMGAIYLDLANKNWEAVEITEEGWRVTASPPVKFRRPRGMQPLPYPIAGGRLTELRPLLNFGSDDDWLLFVGWLLASLRPVGPYPILVLHGEQGSAKSSMARVARMLVDPNVAD